MTTEEQTVANAALGAEGFEDHDQLTNDIAAKLKLKESRVEEVLLGLVVQKILEPVVSSRNQPENSPSRTSLVYRKGCNWTNN